LNSLIDPPTSPFQLCEIKRDQGSAFRTFWDSEILAKHVVFDSDGIANQWYSLDDVEALAEKVRLGLLQEKEEIYNSMFFFLNLSGFSSFEFLISDQADQ
jgi:hypothetical protein